MTKFMRSQIEKGRCVDLPLCGRFMVTGEYDKDGNQQYFFIPHLDFIGSGNFQFPENEFNKSPFGKLSGKVTGTNLITVSLTSLSVVCNTSRDNIVNAVKDIFVRFIELAR